MTATTAIIPFNFASGALAPADLAAFGDAAAWGMLPTDSKPPTLSTNKGMISVTADGAALEPRGHTKNIVILGVEPQGRAIQRTFYMQTFKDDAPAGPPDCWSPDGLRPARAAKSPQAASCETCRQNAAGSGKQEGTKACRFTKHLAVAAFQQDGQLYPMPFHLRVSAQGVWAKENPQSPGHLSLTGLAKMLGARGLHWGAVVSELGCPEGATGGARFKPLGLLSPQLLAQVAAMRESDEFKAIIEHANKPGSGEDDVVVDAATGLPPFDPATHSATAQAAAETKAKEDADLAAAVASFEREQAAKAAALAAQQQAAALAAQQQQAAALAAQQQQQAAAAAALAAQQQQQAAATPIADVALPPGLPPEQAEAFRAFMRAQAAPAPSPVTAPAPVPGVDAAPAGTARSARLAGLLGGM
jgi:hypothetical protein